jgi:microcystin-dependent protein
MNERRCPKPPEPPVPSFLLPDHGMPIGTHGVPIGAVMAFAGLLNDPDKGRNNKFLLEKSSWALCDGRELKVVEYPELFKAIGHVYGGEGGTFNIPDYGGYFLRGVPVSENSKGRDPPDAKKRVFNTSGGGSPGDAGSTQEDALQKHKHKFNAVVKVTPVTVMPPGSAAIDGKVEESDTENPSEKDPFDARTSTETRPMNIYVHFSIKCR